MVGLRPIMFGVKVTDFDAIEAARGDVPMKYPLDTCPSAPIDAGGPTLSLAAVQEMNITLTTSSRV
jgi:hypothetical protein